MACLHSAVAQVRTSTSLRGRAPAELLLAAIFGADTRSDAWRAWTAWADGSGCDSESARLLPLAYRRRDRFRPDPDDPWIHRAADAYRSTWARNHMILRSAAAAARLLHDEGVDVMPVKGVALLERFYADVGVRPMLDVDLLVPADSLPCAVAALKAGSYAAKAELPLAFPFRSVEFTGPDGREVDLHRSLFRDPACDGDEAGRWRRTVAGTLAGAPVRDGHPADLLLHVICHGTLRFTGVCARWVPDALAILGADGFDYDVFVAVALAEGLGPPAAAALDYLRSLAGIDVPVGVVHGLRAAPVSWLTARSFRAAAAAPRWDVASRTPAGVYTLAALVEQRGARGAATVARAMVGWNHGTGGAWLRSRWRRWKASPSDRVGDASVRRALVGGLER